MYLCVFLLGSHPCGTLPAECVFWAGVRRGAGLPSGPSRGRRNSHFGWTVLKWAFVNLHSASDLLEPVSWSVFLCLAAAFQLFSVSLCKGPNWVATLNAGKGGAHASYYHRANKQVEQIPPYCINTPFTLGVCWKLAICVCLCSPDPSWSWVWSQYQDAGDHNLIWVPDGTSRGQHGLSR